MTLVCPICYHESEVENQPVVKCPNCLRSFQLEPMREFVPAFDANQFDKDNGEQSK